VLNRAGYSAWGSIAAVLILVSILWSSWSTHRLIPILSTPVRRTGGARALVAEVVGTLRNPSFMALMASGLVSSIAGGVTATLGSYFTLYYWGLSPQVLGLMLFAYGPAVFIGAVWARRASMRLGKKQSLIWLSFGSLGTSLAPIALRLVGAMPANGSPWLIVVLLAVNFLGVTFSTMASVILASMFADLADDNAVRTGARTEGLMFALNGLIPKISTGLGAFAGSALLALVAFPAQAQQGTVPETVLRALGVAYLPVAAVLYSLSILIIVFYRIDHAAHEANMARLAG
jgi:Na+/melibiose symporter-like transporter